MARNGSPSDAPSVRLRIRVAPGARRTRIMGRYGDGWKISVMPAPEQGRANDAVVTLLADALHVARADVRVVAGARQRDKIVELTGLTHADAEQRLERGAEVRR